MMHRYKSIVLKTKIALLIFGFVHIVGSVIIQNIELPKILKAQYE